MNLYDKANSEQGREHQTFDAPTQYNGYNMLIQAATGQHQ